MKIDEVFVLEEAVEDMNEGKRFYDARQRGVGEYFWDSLISDVESLIIYAGIHKKKSGFYQMLAKRFPYAIYYEIENRIVYVVAVMPMRRDPAWIAKKLRTRR